MTFSDKPLSEDVFLKPTVQYTQSHPQENGHLESFDGELFN
jgi:hypothetical protein